MMKHALLALGLSVMMFSYAGALDLATALKDRKVCEKMDGYIQATPGNEADTAQLVAEVNAGRARVYADIAQKENIPPEAVAAERAQQEKTANPWKFCGSR